MPSIALQRHDVIVGVDTHKDEHIAVAIDGLGGLIDKPKLAAATPDGYAELLVWAQSLGRDTAQPKTDVSYRLASPGWNRSRPRSMIACSGSALLVSRRSASRLSATPESTSSRPPHR